MNNTGYFDVQEMKESTEYFRKLWQNEARTSALIKSIRQGFEEIVKIEDHAWDQVWGSMTDGELIKEMHFLWDGLCCAFPTMLVSQPQHVLPLDEELKTLLEGNPEKDALLTAATYWDEDLPWVGEEREIEELSSIWKKISPEEQEEKLQDLVEEYGWFNDIEGDKPFDKEHYRKKIVDFKKNERERPKTVVPEKIKKVGAIIAELGFLRFWNRYHFMTLRYHLKNILLELIKRTGKPELEFATVSEMDQFFKGQAVDMEEIKKRRDGYSSQLKNGEAEIVTGKRAEELKDLVKEDFANITKIKGTIANKGKVSGRVRMVSFVAKNYNEEVAAFKNGEVLVTGMTRPQIVHLCRLASAIVTDEGGITSHAAVVGREFGIPCIIATHDATKILETGDLVEVDANQGVVTIIEKHGK